MPRTRKHLRTARGNPPLFGPAQDGAVAPGYNVPRGITFEQLREMANRARANGQSPLSVKNQLRAAITAGALGSAAAGALLLRAYDHVDKIFGKRSRGTDASETGTDHKRLRGATEPRTIDPDLPDYEDVSSREDDYVERTAGRIADSVGAAITMQDDEDALEQIAEQERQEAEDQGIRDVLLRMRGDTGDFEIDMRGQNRESFDDLPSGAQAKSETEPLEFGEETSSMPVRIDDDEVMEEVIREHQQAYGEGNESHAREDSGTSASVERAAIGSSGGGSGNRAPDYETRVMKIPPRFPFKQTEQAILEHHGSVCCTGLVKVADSRILRIRMNTPIDPYVNTVGTIGDAAGKPLPWTSAGQKYWGNNVLGRYLNFPGDGTRLWSNYHGYILKFQDPLFDSSLTDPKVAGLDYYFNHYNCYSVTKVEWVMRVEVPYHSFRIAYSTDNAPTETDLKNGVKSTTAEGVSTPPCQTAARVFTHYTMEGDNITSVNPPTDRPVIEMERWNNCYTDKVTVPVNGVRVIRGTWYPGKVKHNPINESDIETWTNTGSVPSSGHLEHLNIQLRERANSNSNDSFFLGANISINLKYYVQFKERKTQIQFPINGQSNPSGTVVNSLVLQNVGGLYNLPV